LKKNATTKQNVRITYFILGHLWREAQQVYVDTTEIKQEIVKKGPGELKKKLSLFNERV